jgi:hypothetical protein
MLIGAVNFIENNRTCGGNLWRIFKIVRGRLWSDGHCGFVALMVTLKRMNSHKKEKQDSGFMCFHSKALRDEVCVFTMQNNIIPGFCR